MKLERFQRQISQKRLKLPFFHFANEVWTISQTFWGYGRGFRFYLRK
jgi:hypothetical protein